MDTSKIITDGITFDDALLVPAKSDFVPSQAETSTRLTNNITINIPIVSAAILPYFLNAAYRNNF